MPTILMLGKHTDTELKEFVRTIRAELLRRKQERAAKKYLDEHPSVPPKPKHEWGSERR